MASYGHSFGRFLKLTVEGASHAPTVSFAVENLPRGLRIDPVALSSFMARRAPGRDSLSTPRKEADAVIFDAGVADGASTGGTLRGHVANTNVRPSDYGVERTVPRPGHADFPQWTVFGRIPTGGGSNSGRLTVGLCAVGGICIQELERRGLRIAARIESIGGRTRRTEAEIRRAAKAGDSVGGVVACTVTGIPTGLGGALFDGLESELSAALFAIPGVKGVSFGNGFEAAKLRGTENNDAFAIRGGAVVTRTNRHGGILGGRASGMPLTVRVAFKPTPTVFVTEPSVDLATMRAADCTMKGRHDPCIARRAVPVVEAVMAFALLDAILLDESETPRICLTLTGRTLEEDLAQYRSQRYFVDLVELRADLLAPSELRRAAEFPQHVPVPTILTVRRRRDGGAYDGSEASRAGLFRRLLSVSRPSDARGFAFVDFEEDFRLSALERLARRHGARVVRSVHDFTGPIRNISTRCRGLVAGTDEVAKIAFLPKKLADVSRLFRETRGLSDVDHVVCAMGPLGLASRVLASRTHSKWTYASIDGLAKLGHLQPRELVRTYRFRAITRTAALYGVTGRPLVFTRSPELNNAAWAAAESDSLMVPFRSETAAEAIAFLRANGLRGLAVTYPHKREVVGLVDELDAAARAIGAANTVVVGPDGSLLGANTDAAGFAAAILAFVGRTDLRKMRVAIIGAGGAAHAVAYALDRLGAKACVFNRTPRRARELADRFGFGAAPLDPSAEPLLSEYSDLIVQCASPGDDPARFDPLAFHRFTGREFVYDLVYEPEVTPTLARAAAAGCRTENGLTMLVNQAAAQRALWSAVS